MLGNRFTYSIIRSALTVASSASVLLCSSAIFAQGYHQTTAPRYARTQLSELSAKATQPPAFGDNTTNESAAMSPNSWSQSAITNPYGGYDRTPAPASDPRRYSSTGANHRGNIIQNSTGRGVVVVNDFFSPTSLNLDKLPTAPQTAVKKSALGKTTPPADQTDRSYSIITPLTNTDYPKLKPQTDRDVETSVFSVGPSASVSASAATSAATAPAPSSALSSSELVAPPAADRYASRSFSGPQAPELSAPPQLPEVEFPFSRKTNTEIFDEIPMDTEAPANIDIPAEIESATDLEAAIDIESATDVEVPAELTGPPISDSAPNELKFDSLPESPTLPTAATRSTPDGEGTFDSMVPAISGTRVPAAVPQTTPPVQTQPRTRTLGYPLNPPDLHSNTAPSTHPNVQTATPRNFSPSPQQYRPSAPAATFQQSPHYAHQSSGPVSNQWGYGYPESGQWQTQPHVETPYSIFDHGDNTAVGPANVGQRSAYPTTRNHTILDRGESFDHEVKKKEFPPFGEIIATGRFFGSLDLAYLRPHFLGNTGISIDGPAFSESIPFEFDNETAPHVRFGFESKYGPGFELNYFTLNANSNPISETFNGVAPITTIASITGPNRFTQLSADDIGETLNVNHSFELETFSFNVFKEIQFKVSRLNGQFGFTYANIAQSLEASVTDGGNNVLDTLQSTSDFRGFGPKFGIEYYRPLGHTPFEFVTSFNGTGLFGRRDQFVNNTTDLVQRRFGADEFVTVLDFVSGLQYKKTIAENRSWFARVAFVHQSWLGGGTAVDPQGDFGLKGFTFGVGFNR